MEQNIDFEFLNFDRELDNLRLAAAKLQDSSAGCGPPLRAYIKALKTLNKEVLGRLDPLLHELRENGGADQSSHGGRPSCQGGAAHSPAKALHATASAGFWSV